MKFQKVACILIAVLFIKCSGMYTKGDQMLSQENFEDAIAEFTGIVDHFPDNYEAHLRLGDAYTGEKQYDKAIDSYKKALIYKPGWKLAELKIVDATFEKGQYLESNEQYRDAIEIYEKIKSENPGYLVVLDALSQIYGKVGQFDKAIDNYKLIEEKNPGMGEEPEEFRKLLELNHEAETLFTAAMDEYNGTYFYEAIESFKKVFELKPDHKEAKYYHYISEGRHHLKRGAVMEMWDAILAFGFAISLKPESAEPVFYTAEAYKKKDKTDYDTPIEHYKKVIELEPDSEFAVESKKQIKDLTETKEKMAKFLKKKGGGF